MTKTTSLIDEALEPLGVLVADFDRRQLRHFLGTLVRRWLGPEPTPERFASAALAVELVSDQLHDDWRQAYP